MREGVGGVILGDHSVLGHDCTVVAFYSPPAEAIYKEWVGKQDHLSYREVMSAPSHYMVNLCYGFNQPTIARRAPILRGTHTLATYGLDPQERQRRLRDTDFTVDDLLGDLQSLVART